MKPTYQEISEVCSIGKDFLIHKTLQSKRRTRRRHNIKDVIKSLHRGETRHLNYLEEKECSTPKKIHAGLLEVSKEPKGSIGPVWTEEKVQKLSPAKREQLGLFPLYEDIFQGPYIKLGNKILYTFYGYLIRQYAGCSFKERIKTKISEYEVCEKSLAPGTYPLDYYILSVSEKHIGEELVLHRELKNPYPYKVKVLKQHEKVHGQYHKWLEESKWYAKKDKSKKIRTQVKHALRQARKYHYEDDGFEYELYRHGGMQKRENYRYRY